MALRLLPQDCQALGPHLAQAQAALVGAQAPAVTLTPTPTLILTPTPTPTLTATLTLTLTQVRKLTPKCMYLPVHEEHDQAAVDLEGAFKPL